MIKAAFLDRDGVINEKAPAGDYITRWEAFHLLPRVAEAIGSLTEAGFHVIVVTNQRCVAKGLISATELHTFHERMRTALAQQRAIIDAVYCCPHESAAGCDCRKPKPGMLFAAAARHNVDLASSWMIGDADIDIEAGKRAGCKTAAVTKNATIDVVADVNAPSLYEAVQMILRCGNTDLSAGKVTSVESTGAR